MTIMYQQPHLVPPMKLTVWDDIPRTPPPSGHFPLSQLVAHGRELASRASERASNTYRRRTISKPYISRPQPVAVHMDSLPFRRRSFRPLELSIYLPDNRLSDLPAFDRLSFSDVGEIRLPPRALLRTRSAGITHMDPLPVSLPLKPASMFERRGSHFRHKTQSLIASESRPPSGYDALHSHPVSWVSLPGCAPHIDMASRHHNSISILSPMEEEFAPPCSAALINDLVQDFAQIEAHQAAARGSAIAAIDPPTPSPMVTGYDQAESISVGGNEGQLRTVRSHSVKASQSQRRVSQWLGTRSHSASINTIDSTLTASSFAEHRRKRSQSNMLSAAPPTPLRPLKLPLASSQHQRTMTISTVASTVETDVMSDNDDLESMTTAPTASEIQSRSGTIKSVSTAGAGLAPLTLGPIVSGVPDLPSDYTHVVGKKDIGAEVAIKEINGPLRSPMGKDGVGLAF